MSNNQTIPNSISRIADGVGWNVALKLMECYPGLRLRIPVKMTDDHMLAQQFGIEGAKNLVKL